MGWVQVTLGVILSSVTPLNNLLLNSYFGNLVIGLYVLYVFDMHANFYNNRMLFTISSINTFFLCIILNYKHLNLNN